VLYNMNDETVTVSLRFDGKVKGSGWRELVHERVLEVSEHTSPEHSGSGAYDDVSLTLRPFEIAVVQSPDMPGTR
jgi:hypothetical protein